MFRPFKCLWGLFLFLIFFLKPKTTEAYIDPATGSYILQMLLAALFAATFAIKVYWGKIKTFLSKHFSKQPGEGQENR